MSNAPLKVGDPAPTFRLPLPGRAALTGASFAGQPLVLAFLDGGFFTSADAGELARARAELRGLGAALLAVSPQGLWCFRADDELQVLATAEDVNPADLRRLREDCGVADGALGLLVLDAGRVQLVDIARAEDWCGGRDFPTLVDALSAAGRRVIAARPFTLTRRQVVLGSLTSAFAAGAFSSCHRNAPETPPGSSAAVPDLEISLTVNGESHRVRIDPRTTLLDALRERIGPDRHARRAATTASAAPARSSSTAAASTSCLTLRGRRPRARPSSRSRGWPTATSCTRCRPRSSADDGFQCGYCTPGQIVSAVGLAAREVGRRLRRRDPRAHERQHLPLRRLPEHRRRDPAGAAAGREAVERCSRSPTSARPTRQRAVAAGARAGRRVPRRRHDARRSDEARRDDAGVAGRRHRAAARPAIEDDAAGAADRRAGAQQRRGRPPAGPAAATRCSPRRCCRAPRRSFATWRPSAATCCSARAARTSATSASPPATSASPGSGCAAHGRLDAHARHPRRQRPLHRRAPVGHVRRAGGARRRRAHARARGRARPSPSPISTPLPGDHPEIETVLAARRADHRRHAARDAVRGALALPEGRATAPSFAFALASAAVALERRSGGDDPSRRASRSAASRTKPWRAARPRRRSSGQRADARRCSSAPRRCAVAAREPTPRQRLQGRARRSASIVRALERATERRERDDRRRTGHRPRRRAAQGDGQRALRGRDRRRRTSPTRSSSAAPSRRGRIARHRHRGGRARARACSRCSRTRTRRSCRAPTSTAEPSDRVLQLLQDDEIHYNGQPIAVVVADTLEHAQHAARRWSARRYEPRPRRRSSDRASRAPRTRRRRRPDGADRHRPRRLRRGAARRATCEIDADLHDADREPQPDGAARARSPSGRATIG